MLKSISYLVNYIKNEAKKPLLNLGYQGVNRGDNRDDKKCDCHSEDDDKNWFDCSCKGFDFNIQIPFKIFRNFKQAFINFSGTLPYFYHLNHKRRENILILKGYREPCAFFNQGARAFKSVMIVNVSGHFTRNVKRSYK